jgi:hypothetical protein
MEKAGTMFRPFLIFSNFVFHSYSFIWLKMNKSSLNYTRFLLLSALLVAAISCGSEKEKEEVVLESDLRLEDEELQLAEMGLQQIQSWVTFWKNSEGKFNLGDFEVDKKMAFEQLEWPEENPIDDDSPFYPYLIPNPEGKGVVDIYSYKIVFPENGGPFLNPDSEVIYFKDNGMRERLLFIGPSGGFEDAVWVTPSHLLVAGFFEEEEGVTPKLWLIDVENSSFVMFKHPLVTTNYSKDGYLKRKLNRISF